MTPADTAAVSLWTLASLGGLFWLMYSGFRSYRVDNFRAQLFDLRSELFDLARKHELAFDHAAYVQLRNTINGFIRFADRLSIVSYLLIAWDLNRMIDRGDVVVVKLETDPAAEGLDPSTAIQLRDIRARMHLAVFEQIIFSSPLFVLTLVPFVLMALIKFVGKRFLWALFAKVYRSLEAWFERAVRPLDAFALQVGLP